MADKKYKINFFLEDGRTQTVEFTAPSGADGKDGRDGIDGKDGEKGDKGETGERGADGSDATVTKENIYSALGYTPANEEEVSRVKSDLNEYIVPDYVVAEADRVAKAVLEVQNANTFSAISMSDMHNNDTSETIETGLLHAGQGANLISKKVKIDLGAFLGDFIAGYSETKEVAINQFFEIHSFVHNLLLGTDEVWLQGNHDFIPKGTEGELTTAQMYSLIGKRSKDVVRPSGADKERGYFYKDYEEHKLRVICLNTSDVTGINVDTSKDESYNLHRVSAVQLQWLCETLDVSEKEDANEWKFWILSHHPLDWGVNRALVETYKDEDGVTWTTNVRNALNVLKAYKNGLTVNISLDGTTVSYDFSGKNKAKIVCNTHGHVHNFSSGKLGDTDIIRFGIPNACIGRENSQAYTDYVQDTTYIKTEGTAEDTSFCVVTFDFAKEVIYVHRYGAGIDRVFSYAKELGVFTINRVLTNCSSSSAITTITEGSTHTETLTANSGYTLEDLEITVTMGGVDISSKYSNGVLNIEEVTGDILIVARVGVVNQIPLSTDTDGTIYNGIGYKTNTRLNSSGNAVEANGYMATGFMPFVRGNTLTTSGEKTKQVLGDSYCYICFYNSSLTLIKAMAIAESNMTGLGITVTNGFLSYTMPSDLSGIYTETAFIRLSANMNGGDGSDFVVNIT